MEYQSVEHAYMSAKSSDAEWKNLCADKSVSAGAVKRASRGIKLVDDWERLRIPIMRGCLLQKFGKSPFMEKLLATGDVHIQEGNSWGDKFWGVCLRTGVGENHLGQLIMEIRKGLQQERLNLFEQ